MVIVYPYIGPAKVAYQACLLFIVEHGRGGKSTTLVIEAPHQIANERHTPQEQQDHRDHEQPVHARGLGCDTAREPTGTEQGQHT